MSTDCWIFAYGSLIWQPGFDYVEACDARLHGLHRRLCIYSHVHRGTPEVPGIVFGLDRGGSCHGMAFRVAAQNREATIQYLRAREQVTMVYLERVRPVTLSDGRRVDAVTYVTDPRHEQYAGKLSLAEMIALARQGHGRSGSAVEYIRNTAEHLDRLGINDRLLRTVVTKLENDME